MSGKKDDLIRREDAIKAVADEHISGSIAEIKDIYNANPFSLTTDFEETLLSIYYSIKDIPAVEMVRCKECVYRYEAQYGIKWCDRTAGAVFTVTDDGYCAWGERKEPQTADGDGEV